MNKTLLLIGAILMGMGAHAYAAKAPAAPSITTQPVNVTVTAPAKATFRLRATGVPVPAYQWMQSVNGGAFTNISGATSAVYAISPTSLADSGTQYECMVSNSSGSVTSNVVTLTVYAKPSITTQPAGQTVTAPQTATFSVVAAGTPAPDYQWEEKPAGISSFMAIMGATGSSYTTPATALANSAAKFKCVITNAAGSVTSSAATLTVYVMPLITTQPVSQTVVAPAKAIFSVTATGTPAPKYQWQQETPGSSSYTPITGAAKASYTTTATTVAQNGTQYECVATNAAGSVTSDPAVLTVNPQVAPIITMQPASQTVTAPQMATFTIIANGTPAPSYQWQSKPPGAASFKAISGATSNSYTTGATALSNSGTQYRCVTKNKAGSTTSNAATLTVINSSPLINIVSPVNQSALTTGSVVLTAMVGEAVNNVAFYNGSSLLGTVTSASPTFTYIWTNVPAGTYSLTALGTPASGSSIASAPVTLTIKAASFTNAMDDNLAGQTDPLGNTTSYTYDNENRLTKTTFADGSMVSFAYDLFGNQTSITDQRGNVLTKAYDAYERLSQIKDPNGGITQFNYDTDGRLLALTDANGNNTSYAYDPNGRLLTQTNALNFTTVYAYDPVGNVSSRTDADGKVTNYTYDTLNRLTNMAYADGTSVAYAYDALGQRTSMTDATGQSAYAYDALGRMLSEQDPGVNNTIAYTYDSEGNRLTSVDQNNRTITNTYDVLNRLSTVADPTGTASYAYDAGSNLLSVTNPNGVSENYTYDALNRILTAVNKSPSAGVISSFSNTYDVAGMITQKTYSDGSWTTYSYDALNQLLSETKQTGGGVLYSNVFTYDPVGNRLAWAKDENLGQFWSADSSGMPSAVLTNMTNAGYGASGNAAQAVSLVRTYTNDAGNRLTGWNYSVNIGSSSFPVQSDSYTYDNNGNRMTKQAVLTGQTGTPEQTTYAYDLENRLNALTYVNLPNVGGSDYLTYNGDGLRVQANLNNVPANYLYDGSNILVERNSSGATTKSYTRGLDFGGGISGIIAQNTTTGPNAGLQYYVYDDLGSTANLTNTSGTTAASYSYDAYGNLLTPQAANDTNRYLFSTKEFDSRSGLNYFGARYYDPEIGRWLTPDPIGFRGGINFYAYVFNNPLNYIDPYGLQAEEPVEDEPPTEEDPNNPSEQSGEPWNNSGGGSASQGSSSCPERVAGAPQPSPNFLPPTNPPQQPPPFYQIPPGWTIRTGPATSQYPNGYWVMYNEYGQPVDPSTGQPPGNVTRPVSRSRTHVPYPQQ